MKQYFLLVLLLNLTVMSLITHPAHADILANVDKIYVVDFKGDIPKNWGQTMASLVSARLLEALQSRHIEVFTWLNLKQQLNVEQKKEVLRCSKDQGCIEEIISGFGIAVKLFGHITRLSKGKYSISLTLMKHARPLNKLARIVNTTRDGLLRVVPGLALQLLGVAGVNKTQNRVIGTGRVEQGVVIDRGENIVNQITDKTGFLVIKTIPPKASIFINNKPVGHAPLQLDQMVGHYVVVAELGRMYHPARQEVNLNTDGSHVTLTLPPAFGKVKITSRPKGAKVLIDGEFAGRTPFNIARKPSGKYALRVTKDYYFDYAGDLIVKDGEVTSLNIKLNPSVGQVIITSDPTGAEVWIDGEQVGRTPFQIARKPAGKYALRVTRGYYFDYTGDLVVENGKTTRMDVTLKQNSGSLTVESSPPGAAVTLDSRLTGQHTPTAFDRMQPGIHNLKLTMTGYGDTTKQVEVENQKHASVLLTLPPKLGLLSVMSSYANGTPCEGDLTVDGKRVGRTPWKGRVLAVTHSIRVRCDKGIATKSITVMHNQNKKVSIKVNPDGAWAVVNPSGGTWTDPKTGLQWQDPPAQPAQKDMTWSQAKEYCKDLVLGGYDDWRLPTISELRALIRGCNGPGKCGNLSVSNYDCNGCAGSKGPGRGGNHCPRALHERPDYWYWSSSSGAGNSNNAWNVSFDYGDVGNSDKDHYSLDARCVRLGP